MVEYPKCLYRFPAQSGQTTEIEGLTFEWRVVPDENAELAAVGDGWALVPTIPVSELVDPTDPVPVPEFDPEPVKVKKHKQKS